MSNRSLGAQTRLEEDRIAEIRKEISFGPGYIMLVSRELAVSYFWSKKRLKFICQTRFDSRLEESDRFDDAQGRRASGKEDHKQEVAEGHAEEDIPTRDLVRMHLDSLKQAIPNHGLPELYRQAFLVFCDGAQIDSVKTAMKSQSFKELDFKKVNILGKFKSESFDPNSSKAETLILESLRP